MRLLLLFLLTLLTSCIDGDEQIWITRNGSGRIEATYKMPAAVMKQLGGAEQLQEKLEDAVSKDPSLSLETISHHLEAGRVVFHFAAQFDDLRELAKFPRRHLRNPSTPSQSAPEEAFFGDIDLDLQGLRLSLDRRLDFSPLLPPRVRNYPELLGNSTFHYILHLPVATTKHNAHSTSNEGRTLTWAFPLRDHTQTSMAITAEAPLPLPWWIWLSIVLLGTLFLLLLVWTIKYTAAQRRG